MDFSVGLQVTRHHKLEHLLAYLCALREQTSCSVHIVVDRMSPEVDAALGSSRMPFFETGGIGNWTSKNVLLRRFVGDGTRVLVLLEDDLEFLQPGVFEYLMEAYGAAEQFMGFYKCNTDSQRVRREREYRGAVDLHGLSFHRYGTLNTSALLVIDRGIVERIGYFCNSFFEMGFYDFRDRLRLAGLVEDLLVPAELDGYLRVDDEVPSVITPVHRRLYRGQVFLPTEDGYRPYDDQPAMVMRDASPGERHQ